MLLLVKKLPWIRFGPVDCVLAKVSCVALKYCVQLNTYHPYLSPPTTQTDHTSQSKAEAAKVILIVDRFYLW